MSTLTTTGPAAGDDPGPHLSGDLIRLADRLTIALAPRHNRLAVSLVYARLVTQVAAEAGPLVVRDLVRCVEQHRALCAPRPVGVVR